MNHAARKHQGFTIIELMLAMAFVTALLLAIAYSIIQIGSIYNRGLTLRDVNQTGRALNDELSRAVNAAAAFDPATSYFTHEDGGRFCTGQVSYLWNYPDGITRNGSQVIRYTNLTDTIQMVKVPDTGGAYCARAGSVFLLTRIQPADETAAIEQLRAGDRSLSVYQLQVNSPTGNFDPVTGQRLYTIDYTIGTGDAAALNADRTACLPPGDINANFTYCAVQQFSLAVRAGNRVN